MGVDTVKSTSPPEKKKLQSTLVVDLLANPSPSHASPSHGECQPYGDDKNGHAKESPKEAKPVETEALPNGKTRTTVTPKTMSKRKMSQHKEKKATQMLAIVLGEVMMHLETVSIEIHHCQPKKVID